ncbi:MAG: hypothetical protein MHPDNHAH_00747 [Anaerolineales bacterium]|nr:hypothetical protein [Anaerolineales bacterium]
MMSLRVTLKRREAISNNIEEIASSLPFAFAQGRSSQ